MARFILDVNSKGSYKMNSKQIDEICQSINEKLLKELKKISFDGFAIVEHDIYNPTQTLPFKIAKKTRDYLKQINFE